MEFSSLYFLYLFLPLTLLVYFLVPGLRLKNIVLLAASLCRSAHLYVWDEPLNFVALFSRIQMEELLLEYRPTLLFVEHDEAFRERVATRRVSLSERGLEKTDKDMK